MLWKSHKQVVQNVGDRNNVGSPSKSIVTAYGREAYMNRLTEDFPGLVEKNLNTFKNLWEPT